ncbi:Leucine-rich repeat-containing protein 15 [Toxocara canis]|uniref:Leucine-rich repeat-containing protein 15 n=1 Tax=Toxocara canis TaxID=6265 RepID=A0A0B2UUV9_TOXCA|nr:Leucine-rich repeat-containing protein 15 [Toxocara canis]
MLLEQHRAFFSYWLQLPASLHIRIGLFEELQRIEIDAHDLCDVAVDSSPSSESILACCPSCSFYNAYINLHTSTLSHAQHDRSKCSDSSVNASTNKRYDGQTKFAFRDGNQQITANLCKKYSSSPIIKHSARNSIRAEIPKYKSICLTDRHLSKVHSNDSPNLVKGMSCNPSTIVSHLSAFSRLLLISILFLLIPAYAKQTGIPGCADIDNLEETFNFETSSLNDLLLCFCKIKTDSSVAISCLYGSSLEDLNKAISLVADANATVDEIVLSHMEFNETGLPDDFFNRNAARLKTLSIELCAQAGALQINAGSLRGLEETLEHLALTDCNIDEIPPALRSLKTLRTLSLARNRLTSITKEDIASHKNLQSLNLAGNFINSMEEGTLAEISDSLEMFVFGEHNFINESIFNEIAQLQNVKVLDLSKADGIHDFPEGIFEKLNRLERLLLMGCSLTTITNQTFRGLNNITELDLRVNLIREVECAAFKWLPNIQRLSLAGNYVNSTKPCVWRDLTNIKELDLSWNELNQLSADTFAQMGATLQILNLRHNANLSQIDENAFRNLTNLRRLNLSDTAMTHIDSSIFAHLTSLEALDLSSSQLVSIEADSLHAQNNTLHKLMLGGNQLRTIPATLLSGLRALRQLDLSSNPWLCDAAIKNVTDEINEKYTAAVRTSSEFSLENANATNCDRPYSLRGENESVVGDESNEGLDHSQTATRAPPEYDVNARQTINDNSGHQLVATLIAVGVMVAVSIAITIAVILYIKERKTENSDAVADTEMNMRPKYDSQNKRNNAEEGKK